ncbi:hypothetical protein T484DRAFT_1880994 [Baffinella frigidus]|nr:hypothetical protein T484DRAFT_1880994 [Cryptophyta sp. CCMP2293]
MASELGNEVWRLVSAIALVALMRVLFDRAGLVLGIVYAAGFFAEQLAKALAHKINIPPLTFMLGAGLLLRNLPGDWTKAIL